MELTNNNKLIAEFMGVFHQGIFPPVTIGEQMYTLDELQYHTSWDWLMPVVKKIDDLFGENDDVDYWINRVHNAVLLFDIDNTYDAVVEFINQYNDERQ